MKSRWLKNVKENLLPLSKEKIDVKKSLQEWFYYDNFHDLEDAIEDCELCGYEGIRYQFEIENKETKNTLLVGSECVKRFQISGVDSDGNVLDQEDTRKKIDKDRRTLVFEARTKRVIRNLVELSQKDNDFDDIDSSIEYLQERGAFSPKHLLFLLWRLEKNNIKINKKDYKMTIKRNREKDQLLYEMKDWQIKKIWAVMSPSQKEWYKYNSFIKNQS